LRTVLCTRAGRLGLGLALAAGLGAAVALPAASAAQLPPTTSRPPSTAVVSQQSGSASAPAGSAVDPGPQSAAVLGPAVKYVRDADGRIRQVR
jgi:hypothetical protein